MIKQTVKNKLKLIFWSALIFLISYIIRVNLAIPTLLICLALYLNLRRLNVKNHNLLNLTLLFLIIFSVSYFIARQRVPVYYMPFSAIPMLVILLFNNLELSLLLALASSITIASLSRYPLELILLFLISGILAGILVEKARKRTTIIRAGFIIGIIQLIVVIFTDPLWKGFPLDSLFFLFNGIVSGIIVLGALPVFEYLFRTVTNISLLEMADFNHPLLQRMVLEAPGTYHHSLVVGNLSETACSAIGANALLARIGAYYHDIGKLQKPGYFIENQSASESRHDTLAPNMSKMIIMNHVREGVELAVKYRLSPALVDFISQHHGNSLVYYFYRRAMESLEEDQEVKEEGFRYPGPRPNTKETAVVLLADSAEAATRALKEPAPVKIEELVRKVINNKFIDGQLEECELTLKDLEKISATFIRILTGIYHSRVTYPEEPRRENNHKKSPKEDSHLSDKDKKGNS